MRPIIAFLLSQSILLPIIIGLINFRRLDRSYRPFFLLLLVGYVTEVVGYIVINPLRLSNYVILNIYVFLEWILIAWQFHVWGFLQGKKNLFYGLLVFTTMCWVVENFVFGHITGMVPYFRFLYFFLVVLLSINKINFMITHEMRNLFRNPKFLICIGFIIYFIYMIVDFWAYEISLLGDPSIALRINFLMDYVNVISNIIYGIAFLMLPKPQKFTLE